VKSYHSDPAIKVAVLAQLAQHAKADEIVKGRYWEGGKGCAVGCTVHSGAHVEYESRFGIPQILAHLEDRIFEGLPNARAKVWPIEFMSAIEPGRDLSLVGWQFLHWLLTDAAISPGIDHPIVKAAVADCAKVLGALASGDASAYSARSAAYSAAYSARSAAYSADAYVLMADKLLALLSGAP